MEFVTWRGFVGSWKINAWILEREGAADTVANTRLSLSPYERNLTATLHVSRQTVDSFGFETHSHTFRLYSYRQYRRYSVSENDLGKYDNDTRVNSSKKQNRAYDILREANIAQRITTNNKLLWHKLTVKTSSFPRNSKQGSEVKLINFPQSSISYSID